METKNESGINILEILKDAPKGLQVRLYSPLIGNCWYKGIIDEKIKVVDEKGTNYTFDKYGKYFDDCGECILFPTPSQTWGHWQEHLFTKGCFVTKVNFTFLYIGNSDVQDSMGTTHDVWLDGYRFATTKEIESFYKDLRKNKRRYDSEQHRILTDDEGTVTISVYDADKTSYNVTRKQLEVIKVVLDYLVSRQ